MPNNFGNDNEVRCSFCGKPQSQAKRLISGNGVYICDECVELCMDIIADEDSLHRGRPQPKNKPRAEMVLPKPQEIKKQSICMDADIGQVLQSLSDAAIQ